MKRDRRFFAIGLIALGAILILTALLYPINGQEVQESIVIPLPEEIAGIPINATVTGAQAVEEITEMHGVDIELIDGARGAYGSRGEVIIWVSVASSEGGTGQLVGAMRDKIGEGNSPFTPMGVNQFGNRTVYVLEGLGQMHYYFQSETLVIWLAANPELAEGALAEVLGFYP